MHIIKKIIQKTWLLIRPGISMPYTPEYGIELEFAVLKRFDHV